MRSLFIVAGLMLASCAGPRADDIKITNAWAQPLNKAGTSAVVYLTISATCTTPDNLRSVRAPALQQASLQTSRISDNALRMTPVRSIAIACGGKQTYLKPMSDHILVTGIPKPLGIGDRIPLTLSFERSGEVAVTADVTTLAVMEDVDPMRMHMGATKSGAVGHMRMH